MGRDITRRARGPEWRGAARQGRREERATEGHGGRPHRRRRPVQVEVTTARRVDRIALDRTNEVGLLSLRPSLNIRIDTGSAARRLLRLHMATLAAKSLAGLPLGTSAIVRRVSSARAHRPPADGARARARHRVEITRVAPLGDPLELRLRNYALIIRRTEALSIEVDETGVSMRPGAAAAGPGGRRLRGPGRPVRSSSSPATPTPASPRSSTRSPARTSRSATIPASPSRARRLSCEMPGVGRVELVDLPGTYSLERAIARRAGGGRRGARPRGRAPGRRLDRGRRHVARAQSLLRHRSHRDRRPRSSSRSTWPTRRAAGHRHRRRALGDALGVEVVPVVARSGEGLGALRARARDARCRRRDVSRRHLCPAARAAARRSAARRAGASTASCRRCDATARAWATWVLLSLDEHDAATISRESARARLAAGGARGRARATAQAATSIWRSSAPATRRATPSSSRPCASARRPARRGPSAIDARPHASRLGRRCLRGRDAGALPGALHAGRSPSSG